MLAKNSDKILYELYLENIKSELKNIPTSISKLYLFLFGLPLLSKRFRLKSFFAIVNQHKLSNKRVLDVGCGAGDFVILLATKFNANAEGVDIDTKKINIAKQISGKYKLNTKFYIKNLENLKLDKKYDLIICSAVLEHIKNDKKLLRVLNKSLSSQGLLFINTPTENRPKSIKHEGGVGHVRAGYEIEDLKRILKQNKFKIIGYQYVDCLNIYYMFYSLNEKIRPILFPLFYSLAFISNLLTAYLKRERGSEINVVAKKI